MAIQDYKRYSAEPGVCGVIMSLIFLLASGTAFSLGLNLDVAADSTRHDDYLYYPDHANSPYTYQSTGDFAATPMVIPATVPIIRQPAYFVMVEPQVNKAPSASNGSAPKKHVRQAVGIPGGYSLHMGSYLEQAQADELEARILKFGLPTFRYNATSGNVRYLQLHAGPFQTDKQVQKAAVLLKKQLNITGRIVNNRVN